MRTEPSSISTGKWQVNSRWTSRSTSRSSGSRSRIWAAWSNCHWAVRHSSASTISFGGAVVMTEVSCQDGLARIFRFRVGDDVYARRDAGVEGSFQRRLDLVGPLHQLTVAAQRLDDLVVADTRPQVGGDAAAEQVLHRVLLERPDAVVADDADDRQPVPDESVELHRTEPEGPVSAKQQDLLVRVCDLSRQRVAGA